MVSSETNQTYLAPCLNITWALSNLARNHHMGKKEQKQRQLKRAATAT